MKEPLRFRGVQLDLARQIETVEFIRELPRTPSGKVLKKDLRELKNSHGNGDGRDN